MTGRYVADTYALVWHLFNPSRLSTKAQHAFIEVEEGDAILYVPSVVIAETAMVIEKGRVKATLTEFEQLLRQMQKSRNYQIGSLDLKTVLAAIKMTQLNDIFDRLIVAEAKQWDGSLITRDEEITAAKVIDVIW